MPQAIFCDPEGAVSRDSDLRRFARMPRPKNAQRISAMVEIFLESRLCVQARRNATSIHRNLHSEVPRAIFPDPDLCVSRNSDVLSTREASE